MPTASTSTPRVAFANRTNATWSLPTPPDDRTLKRRVSLDGGGSRKRAKLDKTVVIVQDDNDVEMQDASINGKPMKSKGQNITAFNALRGARMRPRRAFQNASLSSRPILTSLVSSNKSDVYNLHAQEDPVAHGLPFACAFTAAAKRGGLPILAVATEEGVVELLNTSKRRDWDSEPQRTIIQIHTNAILDVKWGLDDQRLATSSGDWTTRITSVATQQSLATLAYHTSSVKTLDWDPNHVDLLSTASRDGSICVWDLRTATQNRMGEASSTHSPVVVIPHAHCDVIPRGKAAKSLTASKTVTSLLYLPQNPRQLISSGSFDGVLKQWDLRYPVTGRASKPQILSESFADPTRASGSRGRGLSSLALGHNRSAGLMWGMAADACIHTYSLPLSAPFAHSAPCNKLTHPGLLVNSFYIKLATSPCGSWLASGSSGGGVYLWDVATRQPEPNRAVELKATGKEIGAVDWANDSLAACCDDGTVRIWRPDLENSAACKEDPQEKKWDWAWASDDLYV